MNPSNQPEPQYSDRVSCPQHGAVMILVRHELSEMGARWAGRGSVQFYRCTGTTVYKDEQGNVIRTTQCGYARPFKYQKRAPGERHK
jgi:hypothetical protein